MPRVSIILPTYDRITYLNEAVASIVAQTFVDWELIVVDDGSSDGTVEWLDSLEDSRILVLSNPHSGRIARVRNTGIARAKGDWIAFLDSDDRWLPEKLSTQLAALEQQPACRWSCTGVGFISADGTKREQRGGATYQPHSGWVIEKLLSHEAAAPIQTLMVARSLLDDAGGFDESLAFQEDYDLVLKLAAHSELLALPQSLTLVREHPDRTTSAASPIELYRCKETVIRNAAAVANTAAIRRACARALARQMLHRAYEVAKTGARSRALSIVMSAARAAPRDLQVWRWCTGAARRIALGRKSTPS